MATDLTSIQGRTQPSRSAREIPETVAREIIADAKKGSAALQLGRIQNMPAYQHRMPVLSAFASAKWHQGTTDARGGAGDGSQAAKDSAVKQRTTVEWDNVFLTPEELSVLVVVPDAYMADSRIAWEEIRREVAEAFAVAIDEAIFFGTSADGSLPSSFGNGLIPDAVAAGNVIVEGAGTAESNAENASGAPLSDLALDIAAVGQDLSSKGYNLTGFASQADFEWRLRRVRGQDGHPLLQERDGRLWLYGRSLLPVDNGAWDASDAALLGGEWDKLRIGIRQDISFKVFDQATLTDGNTGVRYSAVEQDGKVLRAVMRIGYAVPNPVKRLGGTYPFAVLQPSAS